MNSGHSVLSFIEEQIIVISVSSEFVKVAQFLKPFFQIPANLWRRQTSPSFIQKESEGG